MTLYRATLVTSVAHRETNCCVWDPRLAAEVPEARHRPRDEVREHRGRHDGVSPFFFGCGGPKVFNFVQLPN